MNIFQKQFLRSTVAILLFIFAVYWQYIPVYCFQLDVSNMSYSLRAILTTFSSFMTFFIYYILYRKDLRKELKEFKQKLGENIDTGFKYWIIGLSIMLITNIILTFFLKAGGSKNEKIIQEMIKALPMIMILDAGIIAPFNEEIVFRKALRDIIGKYKWIFIILSAFLFGGAHIIGTATIWKDYLYIIPYSALGFSFALAYDKTNNMFTPIVMHMFHNLVLIILSIMIM